MKTILFALMLCLPFLAGAKEKVDDTKYLAGAVPEENGIVTFRKAFGVVGKDKQQVYNVMKGFASNLVANSIPAPGNYARFTNDSQDTICIRVCEWLVFKNKPLALDRARFRYQVAIFCDNGKVRMEVSQLNYYYEENPDGDGGHNLHAEEWITDKVALNKKMTALYPKSGKFRRKTVDRMEELFEAAMDAFEVEEEPEVVVPQKKVRAHVVEE